MSKHSLGPWASLFEEWLINTSEKRSRHQSAVNDKYDDNKPETHFIFLIIRHLKITFRPQVLTQEIIRQTNLTKRTIIAEGFDKIIGMGPSWKIKTNVTTILIFFRCTISLLSCYKIYTFMIQALFWGRYNIGMWKCLDKNMKITNGVTFP